MKEKTKRLVLWCIVDSIILAFALLWASSSFLIKPTVFTTMGFVFAFPLAAMIEGWSAKVIMSKREYRKFCEET